MIRHYDMFGLLQGMLPVEFSYVCERNQHRNIPYILPRWHELTANFEQCAFRYSIRLFAPRKCTLK